MEKRYKETGYRLTHYLVTCPKCGKDGKVSRNADDEIVFVCNNCITHKKPDDYKLYSAIVKRFCPYCGCQLYKQQKGFKTIPADLAVTCENCHVTMHFKPTVAAYRIQENDKLKHDPYFGFSLWLQSNVRSNLFWAYNYEHLAEIKAYVAAKLRERQSAYRKTMVAWLPQFIKDAKHRKDVLRAIEKMEQL